MQAHALRFNNVRFKEAATFVLMISLFFSAANAQSTAIGKSTEKVEAENRTADFYLPVLVMEQHHGHRPYLPRYRIEIYKSGRGYYHGIRDVKILGEVEFYLSEQEVADLLSELEELGIWNLPTELTESTSVGAPTNYEFTIRAKGKRQSFPALSDLKAFAFQKVIEDHVKSYRWRCPYVNPVERTNFCESEKAYLDWSDKEYRKQLKKDSRRK